MIRLNGMFSFCRKALVNTISRYMISKIRYIDRPFTDHLADALLESIVNNVSNNEIELIDKIEFKRKELLSSEEMITINDYGARSPDQIRSDNQTGVRQVVKSTSDVCKASKSYRDSLLLFKIIRKTEPSICLELGTCLGISASYQATALKMNKNGKLITMEGDNSLSLSAKQLLSDLELDNATVVCGSFQDNLESVLTNNHPVNYAFIDGHHDEVATVEYFEMIQKYLSDTSIVIVDDIKWSEGMKNAWSTIKKNKNVKISISHGIMGICVMNKDIKNKYSFKIPY